MDIYDIVKELGILLKARYPILYLHTNEEEKVEYFLRKHVKENLNRSIYSWDFINGYTNNPNNEGFAKRNPLQAIEFTERLSQDNTAIFLLKDFNKFLTDISIIRKLKNINRILKVSPKTIIIIASDLNIPKELQTTIYLIKCPIPNKLEILHELNRIFQSLDLKLDSKLILYLAIACQGLTLEGIRRIISYIIVSHKTITSKSVELVYKEKQQLVNQNQILNYLILDQELKFTDIGGFKRLKTWLIHRKFSFDPFARDYGAPLPTPRGLVLVGLPGVGKSLLVKAIATEWKLQLVKLDLNKLWNSSNITPESQFFTAIETVENIAPCLLWIDNLDKLFVTNTDIVNRIVMIFQNWLTEKQQQIFVVTTITEFHPILLSLFRKGRSDEIFFLDLPNVSEREEIYRLLIDQLCPLLFTETYNYSELANVSQFLSGAEIRQSILNAMYIALNENRKITTEDIRQSILAIYPMAVSQTQKIQRNTLLNLALTGIIQKASDIDY